jgi:DNA-binding MarR family transcriptional regulator
MDRPGGDLALLLLGGFRVMADRGTIELARRGYDDIRPVHDFALHAILSGADSASDLGRRMSVTKQAAAKIIAVLEDRGYVGREPDPVDRRRKHLFVTDRGTALLRVGEEIFDELREEWEREVGADVLVTVEDALRTLVGPKTIRLDAPGWSAVEEQP